MSKPHQIQALRRDLALDTKKQALHLRRSVEHALVAAIQATGGLQTATARALDTLSARAVLLERELLRAHVHGHAPGITLGMLTGPRRGLYHAWNGRGLLGIGALRLKPAARWRRLQAIAAAWVPELAAEMGEIQGGLQK